MSLLVFPDLPGIDIAQSKRPEIKSQVFVNPLSGRESRFRFQVHPKYIFKLSVNALIEDADYDDLQALMGFMIKIGGQSTAFLYRDPTDNRVDYRLFGQGDGVTTAFQLVRVFGGVMEALHNINPIPNDVDPGISSPYIYVNDVLQVLGVDYGLSDTGLVTFTAPPAVGALIKSTVDFYYRVRLLADGYDFVRIAYDAYECQDIEFVGSVRNIV